MGLHHSGPPRAGHWAGKNIEIPIRGESEDGLIVELSRGGGRTGWTVLLSTGSSTEPAEEELSGLQR